MNLSHDGTISTTNIVLQNLERMTRLRNHGLMQDAKSIKDDLNRMYIRQLNLCDLIKSTIKQLKELSE